MELLTVKDLLTSVFPQDRRSRVLSAPLFVALSATFSTPCWFSRSLSFEVDDISSRDVLFFSSPGLVFLPFDRVLCFFEVFSSPVTCLCSFDLCTLFFGLAPVSSLPPMNSTSLSRSFIMSKRWPAT